MVLKWKDRENSLESMVLPSEAANLDGIPLLSTAFVVRIDAPETLQRHLLELGFTEGTPVTFFMSTPFGDPKVFLLRGASIAMRRSEARCIRVRL